MSRSKSDLIKRWRMEEVKVWELGAVAGIYVERRTGTFYARVPETDHGTRYEADTLPELRAIVERELKRWYTLEWRDVIRVTYGTAYTWRKTWRGSSGRSHTWIPGDPSTASDTLGPLQFVRRQIAIRHDGVQVMRERPGGRISSEGKPEPYSDTCRDLPWSEETWAALVSFKEKLKLMDHQIRTLLVQPDLEPRLIRSAAATPLLTTNNTEDENR